jgi:hypothetical protein
VFSSGESPSGPTAEFPPVFPEMDLPFSTSRKDRSMTEDPFSMINSDSSKSSPDSYTALAVK